MKKNKAAGRVARAITRRMQDSVSINTDKTTIVNGEPVVVRTAMERRKLAAREADAARERYARLK